MTTHPRSTAPRAGRLPRPGPARHLVALPDPAEVSLSSPAEVHEHLRELEVARQRQLEELPAADLDPVTAAYRATVEGILAEVRTALARVVAGTYGTCSRCGDGLAPERLELRPWATTCVRCAATRDHGPVLSLRHGG